MWSVYLLPSIFWFLLQPNLGKMLFSFQLLMQNKTLNKRASHVRSNAYLVCNFKKQKKKKH